MNTATGTERNDGTLISQICSAFSAVVQDGQYLLSQSFPLCLHGLFSTGKQNLLLELRITEEDRWARLDLDTGISCLPGCKTRFHSCFGRIYQYSPVYRKGTYWLDEKNRVHLSVSLLLGRILAQPDCLKNELDELNRTRKLFDFELRKICSGQLLNFAQSVVLPDKCRFFGCGDDESSTGMKQQLARFFAAFDCIGLREKFCGENNSAFRALIQPEDLPIPLTLDLRPDAGRRVLVDLALPLPMAADTAPVLYSGFNQIYQNSRFWHLGSFFVDENGSAVLRVVLTFDKLFGDPQVLDQVIAESQRLAEVFYPMLAPLAKGQLLPWYGFDTARYEDLWEHQPFARYEDLHQPPKGPDFSEDRSDELLDEELEADLEDLFREQDTDEAPLPSMHTVFCSKDLLPKAETPDAPDEDAPDWDGYQLEEFEEEDCSDFSDGFLLDDLFEGEEPDEDSTGLEEDDEDEDGITWDQFCDELEQLFDEESLEEDSPLCPGETDSCNIFLDSSDGTFSGSRMEVCSFRL